MPKKKPQPVPAETFGRLLEAAGDDPLMRAYLLCGWLAGLRLAEAFSLEWASSDKAPWRDTARGRIILPAEICKGVVDQWVTIQPDLREALPRTGRKVFPFTDRSGGPLGISGVSIRVRKLA